VSGSVLEDEVVEAFKRQGYVVFVRKNHCDILAMMPKAELA